MSEPRKEVLADGVELWLGDCREVLNVLPVFDAAVFDPPYGIGESAGKAKTRTSGLNKKVKKSGSYRRDYGDDDWDNAPLSGDIISKIQEHSKWQIIFGGNYYALPPTSCWLVWDKLNGNTDFADCELAWTNLPKAVRRFRYLWNGCMRMEKDVEREHPTQKPVGVMDWCMGHLPPGTMSIIDPTMGVGTTGVAAIGRGFEFSGIEQHPRYFDIACRRVSEALKRPRLSFVEPAMVKQEALPL